MERVIKNIVFDLGGVIMTLDPAEALRRFKALGLSDAERYLDAYTQSGIFGNLEEGKITAEDFRSKSSARIKSCSKSSPLRYVLPSKYSANSLPSDADSSSHRRA